jgi:hypothetical protein
MCRCRFIQNEMLESIQQQSKDDELKKALADSTTGVSTAEDEQFQKALAESNTAITEEEQLNQALQMSMQAEASGSADAEPMQEYDALGEEDVLAKALAMSREGMEDGMVSEEEQMRKAVEASMLGIGSAPSDFGGIAVDDFGTMPDDFGAAHFGGGAFDDPELAQVLAMSMEEHAAARPK